MQFPKPVQKIAVPLGAAALAFSLSACGSEKEAQEAVPATTASTSAESTAPAVEKGDGAKQPEDGTKQPEKGSETKPNSDYDGSAPSGNNPETDKLSKPENFNMKPNKFDGLEAQKFSGLYLVALNYAAATGDVSRLREMRTDNCETCKQFEESLVKLHKEGGYYKAVPEFRTINLVPDTSKPGLKVFKHTYETPGTEIVNPDGSTRKVDGGTEELTFEYSRDVDGVYKITKLTHGPASAKA